MTTTDTRVRAPGFRAVPSRRSAKDHGAAWVVVAASVVAAILTLVPAAMLGSRGAFVSGGLAVVILLAALALRSFMVFLVLVLQVRPLLDVFKTSSDTGLFELTSLLSLVFLAAGCLWLAAQREATGPWRRTPLMAVLTAVFLFTLLSTASSLHPMPSLIELLKLASWVVMFLVVRRLASTDPQLKVLLVAVAASAALPLLVGYFALTARHRGPFWEVKDGILRLTSTFDQSNNLARFIMLIGLVGLAVVGHWRTPRARLVMILGLATLPVPFFFTYTRAAWLGAAVGLIVALVLMGRKLTALVLVSIAVVAFALPTVRAGLEAKARPQVSSEITNDSVAWRYQYWQEVLDLTQGHQLLGIGPGSTVLETLEGKEPHNEYLRSLVEGGVLGLISFLALLSTAMSVAVRSARDALIGHMRRAAAVGSAAVISAVAAAGLASNIFDSISFMWYFAILLGIVDASARRTVRSTLDDTEVTEQPRATHPAPLDQTPDRLAGQSHEEVMVN